MKRTNIYLDEAQSRLLRHIAIEEQRSFTDLVREALREYLVRRGVPDPSLVAGPRRAIPDQEWREHFDELLERIRSRSPAMSPEQIESEITAARQEVRFAIALASAADGASHRPKSMNC